ncbi:hypothetical protein HPB51_017530 [Rhipicephalus microplus]|uniref:BTB domain-containing protein n=1 Tax=Rhipicephalus microplus TaxID=6941 RepID=A0A9J6F7U0_RHIMP|nr:hypothetical protein HPB51_017530 [Rhipicephalus microplus]
MSAVFWGDQSQQELEGMSRDCVIRTANGGEFRVHRGFLGASSPVFQALFSVNQGGRCDVLLQDVSASTMDALLGYCYSNKVWRTSDEFPVVTESLLVELLSSNELNVHDEVDLLHAIVRWSSARSAFAGGVGATMSRLLQSFRVGLCDSLALEDFCRSHPTLACSRAFSQVVWEPQQQGPCLCSPSPLLLVQCAARCSSPGAADAVPPFDGYGDSSNTNVADAAATKRRASKSHTDYQLLHQSARDYQRTSFPQLECERCGSARNPERWLPAHAVPDALRSRRLERRPRA